MDEAPPYAWDAARGARSSACSSGWSCALPEWRRRRRVIRFYIARQRFDAYLLADRLNQAGIRAHVFNEHASSIVGDVPPDVAQPQVWLERDDDLGRADGAAALDGSRRRARRHAALSRVRRGLAGNFDLCWNCGHALHDVG